MVNQAIILAGGKGTRLSSRLNGLPKPLVDFNGKPLLWYQIKLLEEYAFNEVIILVNHKADKIVEYIESIKDWKIKIKCIEEKKPLGTSGAVLSIFSLLSDEFLVIYGDTILDVDINRFYNFHKKFKYDLSLFVHPNNHPYDSDLVEVDNLNRVKSIHTYPHKDNAILRNLVNAALYIIKKESLPYDLRNKRIFSDFGKDLFPKLLKLGINIGAYNSPEYIKDCGTPSRLDSAINDYKTGKINSSNLRNKQKVIFLDRDGTINRDVNHLNSIRKFEFLDGVEEAIKLINQSSYRCIIITNQPVIARGECSYEKLYRIHAYMETLLGKSGAFIDRIYFCPHHTDKGFKGEVENLKFKCKCRKPEIGMLLDAKNDFNIDFNESWFIGDTTVDIMTAKNAEIKSILLGTGKAGKDNKYTVSPNYKKDSLLSAVKFVLSQ